ncbi:AraC family transcriptional regulator [Bacillus horti]|uniref:YesN/AraC family two-component response regulator n=1 Tax=Caldalkalibacillus horti TaxID=77523 RepID=A0ABT9VVD8_9BACI|nr:AraC family transcriptional regulator [Bacillus horti]MDQ0164950.1 YesN/AraC family two-component response regulator [Bacillus horti]
MNSTTLNSSIVKKFMKTRMENKQNMYAHPSYTLEQRLLHCVARGELEEAKLVLSQINQLDRARLADNQIRSLKNSLIITCSLFTRAIIKGGLLPEDAFNLSDVYIQQIEKVNTKEELDELEYEMLVCFVDRLHAEKKPAYNYTINRAITFIHEELLKDLSLEKVAEHVNVHPNYLSKMFKESVGVSLTEFINSKRIEESKYFLLHSKLTISNIAQLFQFCNQSYYSSQFKKYAAMTPKQYRDRHALTEQLEA